EPLEPVSVSGNPERALARARLRLFDAPYLVVGERPAGARERLPAAVFEPGEAASGADPQDVLSVRSGRVEDAVDRVVREAALLRGKRRTSVLFAVGEPGGSAHPQRRIARRKRPLSQCVDAGIAEPGVDGDPSIPVEPDQPSIRARPESGSI